jgi:outer membrane protein OmpU
MKKVLFATSALVATAGIASADIAISGDGRMGIVNVEDAAGLDNETQFSSRLRVAFTASGTTDGGIAFGGGVRADNAAGGAAGTAGSVYISGAFGKITMGDIDSAHEAATGDLHGVGYGPNAQNEMGYIGGGDDEGVSYTYSMNGLNLFLSAGQPQADSNDDETAFGVNYTISGVTVGVGSASDGAVDETSVAISGSVAGVALKAIVLDRDNHTVTGESGFSASYAFTDAFSMSAFTRTTESAAADRDYTGVGFAYNLGGGATLAGGIVDGGGATNDDTAMDFGVKFSF